MPAVPKRRISSRRRGNRRSHWVLKTPRLVHCSQCAELKRPHHVCPSCGTYRGSQVIELKED